MEKTNQLPSVTIKDFHKNLDKEFSKRSLGLPGTGTTKIPFSLYKKIVKTYFAIYFGELFFSQQKMYFFLGGHLQIVKVLQQHFFSKSHKKENLQLFWGDRISEVLSYFVKILKQKGKTNCYTKLETLAYKNIDIHKFATFDKSFKKKLLSNDVKYYRNRLFDRINKRSNGD